MRRKLTERERQMMATLPFNVYSPSSGGGREWGDLIRDGFVSVDDVGDDQETVLLVSATEAGRRALSGEA